MLLIGAADGNAKTIFDRLNCLSNSYGFVTRYLILYLMAPILNSFVEKSNKYYLACFVFLFFIIEGYAELTGCREFNLGYDVLHFCGLYLCGRLLNLCKIEIKNSFCKYILISVVISLIAISYKIIARKTGAAYRMIGGLYDNPLVVLQSVFLFFTFKNAQIKSCFINWVGSSVFSVFLLHMHPDIKQYYYAFTDSLYELPFFQHLLELVTLFFIIFVVSTVIDKIRLVAFNQIWPTLYKLIIKTRNTFKSKTIFVVKKLK